MKSFLVQSFWKKSVLSVLIIPLLSLIFAIASGAAPVWATGVYDLPTLTTGSSTYLLDQAEAISRANEGTLNNDLKKLSKQTNKEVRFVAIRRLNFDETIDGFVDKLFQAWYPTSEEQTNQILLVLDTLTNSSAIRSGESVKSLLTEDISKSIVTETIAIPLRDGSKYNQALLGADQRISALLNGEADPGPPIEQEINLDSTFTSAEETDDQSATFWVVVFLVFATLIPMITYFWYVGFPGR